jgi:hypothetical protein
MPEQPPRAQELGPLVLTQRQSSLRIVVAPSSPESGRAAADPRISLPKAGGRADASWAQGAWAGMIASTSAVTKFLGKHCAF